MNALALLLVAALLAPPVVADAPAQARTFHRFSFGRANGTVLSDGPLLYAENPFLVPALAVERNYAAAGRSTDPITLEQNVAVIDLPGVGRVMVDTGSRGDEPSPISPDSGRLFDNLKLAGIAPESIDYVVLTHGHLDHVNGLRLPGGGKAFPNAQVFINKKEHDFWSNPPKAANATDTSPEALRKLGPTTIAHSSVVRIALEPPNPSPRPLSYTKSFSRTHTLLLSATSRTLSPSSLTIPRSFLVFATSLPLGIPRD